MSIRNINSFYENNKEIIWVLIVSLILRLIIMPYTQSVDADAATRTLISENLLLNHFKLIYSGVWPPIHFYFNALILALIPNVIIGPKILQILFTIFSLVPLYLFTKLLFNKTGAIYAALIYSFSPIVFRYRTPLKTHIYQNLYI